MSMRRSKALVGRGAAALGFLALAACSVADKPRRLPGGFRLVQKDQFQALYGPDGRIVRLLQDRDHDGRAEAVIVYGPSGKPERGEIDTDGDGSVDRWEHFRLDGSLERVEIDTNRDGRADRSEYPQ
jgi:hypothetical protein